jgi:probable phosphoglycerate mutase
MDLALNATGEAQAVAVGRRFVGSTATALYSSDLLRARQTAQPISEALHLPIILLQALRERHFGRCEGMTLEEIFHQYDDDARAIQCHDPDYASPGGGESRRQHQVRVLDCIEHMVREHEGQTIVVVTHGGALDVIYRRACQLLLEAPRDYPIPNAGMNWIGIDGDQWSIESWGDDAHLG